MNADIIELLQEKFHSIEDMIIIKLRKDEKVCHVICKASELERVKEGFGEENIIKVVENIKDCIDSDIEDAIRKNIEPDMGGLQNFEEQIRTLVKYEEPMVADEEAVRIENVYSKHRNLKEQQKFARRYAERRYRRI